MKVQNWHLDALKKWYIRYASVYVDELIIAAHDPSSITNALTNQHQFKLKGTGPLQYHLGCDCFKDNTGTLCFGTRKNIEKTIKQYKSMNPKKYTLILSHLKSWTKQESRSTNLGSLQWEISLGRFDIQMATMTMSRFRSTTKKGHLEHLKNMYGYLRRFKSAAIRVSFEEPDFSSLPVKDFDWLDTVQCMAM
jgi:hypothetical protein